MVLLLVYGQRNSGGLDSIADFPTDFLQDLWQITQDLSTPCPGGWPSGVR